MYIPRNALSHLERLEQEGKVVVIYGPRRVGKTTLLKKYLENKQDYLFKKIIIAKCRILIPFSLIG